MNFFGKYRGTVVDNVDPEQRGRLRVQVPAVQGINATSWADACLPLSGTAALGMGVFWVPPIGAAVWVEFEGGDPNLPIWSGCRFSHPSEVPSAARGGGPADARLVLQSRAQNSIVISDVAGEGISLRAASGARITLNENGITISTPGGARIELVGNTVRVNGDALEVT